MKQTTTFASLALFVLCSIPSQAQPNIVLIVADDLGYGDLSSYGSDDLLTPRIDDLVQQGVRFNYFYANSPVCSPTRASLLSGRYPPFSGVPGVVRTRATDSWGYLSPDVTLLPLILKRGGYHTAIIGKWHLGLESPNTPLDRGFDFFHGFLGDMMDDYYTHRRHGLNYMRRNREVIDPEGHATDLFAQWAVEYVQERAKSSAPFFLYLAFNAPHAPIQPPEEWLTSVSAREPGIDETRAKLVAFIEHMDDAIGRVLAELRALDLDRNTLLIFTSDNGGQINIGANNGPLRAGKGTVYEGGIRVPATIVWPDKIPSGSVSDRMLLTMDLYPTIAEAAGIQVSHAIDGRSFLEHALGGDDAWTDRDLFYSRREGNPRFGGKTIEAVRSGDWKLMQNSPFGPLELYNLSSDPLEMEDLSAEHPEVMASLSRKLREYVRLSGSVPWQPPGLIR